eukprot:5113708-Lingulodinium_polyedra.AAC.1
MARTCNGQTFVVLIASARPLIGQSAAIILLLFGQRVAIEWPDVARAHPRRGHYMLNAFPLRG